MIHPICLMDIQSHQLSGFAANCATVAAARTTRRYRGTHTVHDTLIDVRQIPQIEDVMKLDGRRQEGIFYTAMKGDAHLHQQIAYGSNFFAETLRWLFQMIVQYIAVYIVQRLLARCRHREHTEMTLQSRIDGEGASRRIHAGGKLTVANVLQLQPLAIVPKAGKSRVEIEIHQS